jgi:hypothetical protein
MRFESILFCFLLLTSACSAQDRFSVRVDSVVISRPDTIAPYPFQSQIDSIRRRRQKIARNAEGFVHWNDEKPKVFVRTDTGRTRFDLSYGRKRHDSLRNPAVCLVQFRVAWTSTIQEARIRKCTRPLASDANPGSVLKRITFASVGKIGDVPGPGVQMTLRVIFKGQ